LVRFNAIAPGPPRLPSSPPLPSSTSSSLDSPSRRPSTSIFAPREGPSPVSSSDSPTPTWRPSTSALRPLDAPSPVVLSHRAKRVLYGSPTSRNGLGRPRGGSPPVSKETPRSAHFSPAFDPTTLGPGPPSFASFHSSSAPNAR